MEGGKEGESRELGKVRKGKEKGEKGKRRGIGDRERKGKDG